MIGALARRVKLTGFLVGYAERVKLTGFLVGTRNSNYLGLRDEE